MKIIFDFDDVLFNANAFKELMFFYLEERGIRNARELYKQMRKREKLFSPSQYLNELGIKKDERATVYEGIMTPCAWLFNKEMVGIMSEIGEENFFIISQGDEAFQEDKIDRAIGDQVLGSHIIIVPDSKREEVIRICMMFKDEDVIFVDDKIEFLNNLPMNELPNLKTVLFDETGLEKLKALVKELKK